MSETRSCSRWAYEDQRAEEEVERELAEMTGSLETTAETETKGNPWAYISRCEVRKLSQTHSGEEGICCSWCVGRSEVCGRGGGAGWEGEVCRSGEGMWDSAGNGPVEWHV